MLMVFLLPLKAYTNEAYVVFNNSSLMFYYDNDKANRTGDIYPIAESYGADLVNMIMVYPEWSGVKASKVIFDNSFAGYTPTSTAYWFYRCSASTFTGLNNLNTSKVTDMTYMFYRCSASSLDLSKFNTGQVTSMNSMFCYCKGLKNLDLRTFNTSNVTDMASMFCECNSLESVNLSSFNTSKVTNMSEMFADCKALKNLDLSSFNTSNVSDMNEMFEHCEKLTSLNLSNFNTGKVANMSSMFGYCYALASLDLSAFNTVNVTTTNEMFYQCRELKTLKLNGWNTTNIRSMSKMFADCGKLTSLDLSSFDTSKVTEMFELFWNNESLKTIEVGDGWNTDKVVYEDWIAMFASCTSLVGGSGTVYFEDRYLEDLYLARVDGGKEKPGYLTYKAAEVPKAKTSYDVGDVFSVVTEEGVEIIFRVTNTSPNECEVYGNELCPTVPTTKKNVIIPSQVKGYQVVAISDYAFHESNIPLISIPASVRKIGYYCMSGDVKDLKVEKGNPTYDSREDCGAIIETATNRLIYGSSYGMIPSTVESISGMAYGGRESLTSITIPASVKTIGNYAFDDCDNLYTVVSLIPTPYAIESHTFENHEEAFLYVPAGTLEKYKETAYWSKFENITEGTPEVEEDATADREPYAALSHQNRVLTFYYDKKKKGRKGTGIGPFVSPELREWHNVSDLQTIIFDKSFADYDGVTSTAYWFYGSQAKNIVGLERLNTSNVTDMQYMFSYSRIEVLDLSSFNTSKVTNMKGMLFCRADVDVSSFNTENVTDMSYMFGAASYGSPNNIKKLDLRNFNTSNVTDMSRMFSGCVDIKEINVCSFDTHNVTNMEYMFNGCGKLRSLDISNFDTRKVTNMAGMFNGCGSLTSLDVSRLRTENVTDMTGMFGSLESITELNLNRLNTANVKRMTGMFGQCKSLTTLKIENFITENVTEMDGMFWNCPALETLDLSSFQTENVTNMSSMFENDPSLKTIYVSEGWSTKNVLPYTDMFNQTRNIVGGAGTKYQLYAWQHPYDVDFARVDGGTENPGYFTYKKYNGNTGLSAPLLGKYSNAPIYDLNGRMYKSPRKGLHIIDGIKVLK